MAAVPMHPHDDQSSLNSANIFTDERSNMANELSGRRMAILAANGWNASNWSARKRVLDEAGGAHRGALPERRPDPGPQPIRRRPTTSDVDGLVRSPAARPRS